MSYTIQAIDVEPVVESNCPEPDFAKPEMQEARAFLRERFLRFVTGIVGQSVKFDLFENSKVAGEFQGTDVDFLEIYVKNLETPLGKIPDAILRATDIITFQMDEINISKK